jgi:hypothetical protein
MGMAQNGFAPAGVSYRPHRIFQSDVLAMRRKAMSDPRVRSDFERDPVRRDNPFDTPTGYSGQEYTRDREAAEGRRNPPGGKKPDIAAPPPTRSVDIPPENGRRAFLDPETGEVHGSGSGAGGGNPGEDFDNDAASGDGVLVTGASDKT